MTHYTISRQHRPTRLIIPLALVALILGLGLPSRAGAFGATSPTTTATTFITLLAKSNFSAAEQYLAPTMQAVAPTAKLQQIWEQLLT